MGAWFSVAPAPVASASHPWGHRACLGRAERVCVLASAHFPSRLCC